MRDLCLEIRIMSTRNSSYILKLGQLKIDFFFSKKCQIMLKCASCASCYENLISSLIQFFGAGKNRPGYQDLPVLKYGDSCIYNNSWFSNLVFVT